MPNKPLCDTKAPWCILGVGCSYRDELVLVAIRVVALTELRAEAHAQVVESMLKDRRVQDFGMNSCVSTSTSRL